MSTRRQHCLSSGRDDVAKRAATDVAIGLAGGTTVAAIRELERHGVRAALMAAIEAAHARSVELGRDAT